MIDMHKAAALANRLREDVEASDNHPAIMLLASCMLVRMILGNHYENSKQDRAYIAADRIASEVVVRR
jgi:hypothetical protein